MARSTLTRLLCLAIASASCNVGRSLVVGKRRLPDASWHKFSSRARRRSSPMRMYLDDMDMPPISSSLQDILSSSTSKPSRFFGVTPKSTMIDPGLEVEILNDASHIALDVSTFLSPNTTWLRFCNLVGRILILASDYIQDDRITSDEWVFNAAMLAVSCHMFARNAWPVILAMSSVTTLTIRERRVFALLFDAVGITVLQFKTLLASGALEWVEYAQNERVELSGDMYFLYSGNAAIQVASDMNIEEGTNSSLKGGFHMGARIFGDVEFSKVLDATLFNKSKKSTKCSKRATNIMSQVAAESTSVSPRGHFVVGPRGAAMLRVNSSKLLRLMKHDNELSNSIQRLVLLCMQEKLSGAIQGSGIGLPPKESALQGKNSSSSTPNVTHVERLLV